jgi:hypothetical protein
MNVFQKVQKLPQRLHLKLVHCRRCCGGWLRLDMITGQGHGLRQREVERFPVQKEFVRAIGSPVDPFRSGQVQV